MWNISFFERKCFQAFKSVFKRIIDGVTYSICRSPLSQVATEFQLATSSNSHQSDTHLAFWGKVALEMPIPDVSSLNLLPKVLGFNKKDVGRCFVTTHTPYNLKLFLSHHSAFWRVHSISIHKVWVTPKK